MVSYPDSSYCVKCKSHTETLGKHSVLLSNKRRALKGVCPICATETYRLLPTKKDEPEQQLSLVSQRPTRIARPDPTVSAELPVYTQALDPMSQVEHLRVSLAQRLVNYGVLSLLFGCSVALGFVLCMALLD